MEKVDMGRVVVPVVIENVHDSIDANAGLIAPAQVRRIEVSDALIDAGARMLCLPKHLIDQLGLEKVKARPAHTAVGVVSTNTYRAVWLQVQGRQCTVDVAEVSDDCPVSIGYIPLENLDFVVDPVGQRLIGNPEHNGQDILDLY
jgi:predicted aspartyl protease